MMIRAFHRPDGTIGIRNHVVVLPTSVCAGTVAARISAGVKGTVALPHQHGCCQMAADHEQTVRTLTGLGRNPNVSAVLVVALGCEGIRPDSLAAAIAETGKPVETVSIQDRGGIGRTVDAGVAIVSRMAERAATQERREAALAQVVLGLECGGSDATSGLVGNPAVGRVSDRLIAAGGTSILSETSELIGAEHLLAARARTPAVAARLLSIVKRIETRAVAMGQDIRGSQPTPGNIEGGITTIEEKSLGCIHKAGAAPLEGVLDYAEPPAGRGLYMMDTPGQDIESITGMVAGGAQIVTFTTGRGTPTGCPIAPVLKITGNSATFRRMADCTDINAGRIMDGDASLAEVADEIFDRLVRTCNGELTKAEVNGHREFAIHRIGFTF